VSAEERDSSLSGDNSNRIKRALMRQDVDSPDSPRKIQIAEALSKSMDGIAPIKERQVDNRFLYNFLMTQEELQKTRKPLIIYNESLHARKTRN
jgi:hypothetical protein